MDPVNPTPSLNLSNDPPTNQPAPVYDKPASASPIISLILLSLFLLTSAISAFLYFQNQSLKKQLNELTQIESQPTPTPTPTPDPTANWQTYTNTVRKYQFRYPPDWTLDASKADIDPAALEAAELELTKGNYQISILWPSAYGPSVCVFDDQSRSSAPTMASYCEGEFKEFQSTDHQQTYRRLVTPQILNELARWSIYTKEDTGNFVTVPPITYTAPSPYTDGIITLMDQILSTFKFISDDRTQLSQYLTEQYYEQGKQYGKTKTEIVIDIKKLEGNYAFGSGNYKSGGGDTWFATKSSGNWQLIWQGQEPPSCQQYNFPQAFYEHCSQ